MYENIKAWWTEALRSGEYPQSFGALRTKSGYCCLGVLCDLYDKEHATSSWKFSPDTEWHTFNTDGDAFLPKSVQVWAGLNDSDPYVFIVDEFAPESGKTFKTTLSNLNDTWKTFAEIANVIEEQL